MKIDNTIVNLMFNNFSILEGANTFLCSEFQLSKDDGISFLCYLTQQSDVSKDALSKLLKEWRANKTETSFAEEVDLNTNNVNSLLPLFGIQEKYERNDEAISVIRTLSEQLPREAGSLTVVICDIVRWVRAIQMWGQLHLRRYVSRNYYPSLYQNRRKISGFARILSKMDRTIIRFDGCQQEAVEYMLRHLPKWPEGAKNLLRLLYSDGYAFNKESNKERASAIVWLKSIIDYHEEHDWRELTWDILTLISERNIIISDPFLNYECEWLRYDLASGFLDEISNRFEENSPENSIPLETNTGGRGKGTWHTEQNGLEDAIWTAIFTKIWSGHLKQQIAYYYYGDRKPKKVQKEIALLGAAHIYLALEKEGFAKKYGDNGTKLTFWETLHSVIDFRRQSLDDYMLLMYLIDQINSTIEQETFNDRLKDRGFEKTDSACQDATTKVTGKMRIAKGDASQIWAVELAKFRKEHHNMYSLLGEDIISANFTIDKELEDYKYNNINKMIKTDLSLRREICRLYQDLARGQKYSNVPKQAKIEDGSL